MRARIVVIASLGLVAAVGTPALAASGHASGPSEPSTCANDIGLSLSQNVLWPPNHKLVPVTITVSDRDGDSDMPMVMVASITNNDETSTGDINGSGPPDATPAEDQQGAGKSVSLNDDGTTQDTNNTKTITVQLAAERSGHDVGTGRTYDIKLMCTMDDMTGSGTADLLVNVPHDQGTR